VRMRKNNCINMSGVGSKHLIPEIRGSINDHRGSG